MWTVNRIHPSRATFVVRLEQDYAVIINRINEPLFGRKGLLLIATLEGSDYVEQSTLTMIGRMLHDKYALEMHVLIATLQSAWLGKSCAYVISSDHPLVIMAPQSEACGQNDIGVEYESGNLNWVLTNDKAQACWDYMVAADEAESANSDAPVTHKGKDEH